MENYDFRRREQLAEPVLYKGEWIDYLPNHSWTKRKIRSESNPIVSHIHIYRDGLKGSGCMKTRENASRMTCRASKNKTARMKEIWLAFCGLNPGYDPKRVNASLDPYYVDLVT
jgi:hypothetical protein